MISILSVSNSLKREVLTGTATSYVVSRGYLNISTNQEIVIRTLKRDSWCPSMEMSLHQLGYLVQVLLFVRLFFVQHTFITYVSYLRSIFLLRTYVCTNSSEQIPLHKQSLATIAAQCERYIGTQGGGMDQAIAFLAKQGTAQYIEWNPLTATPVTLPSNAIFVIANSLTEANKAASHDFNQRVVECRLGCKYD